MGHSIQNIGGNVVIGHSTYGVVLIGWVVMLPILWYIHVMPEKL